MTVNQKLTNEQLSSVGIKRTDNDKDMRTKEVNIKNHQQAKNKSK